MGMISVNELHNILIAIPLLAHPTLVLVATLVVGCAILFGVDLARNVRVIRLQRYIDGR